MRDLALILTPPKILTGAVMAVVLVGALSFMPANWTDRMSTTNNYQQDESAEGI